MELKHIHLVNIRSYQNQKIDFKKGSTLLLGNIGSGKTSILLAIEFCIFGLIKGQINPSYLLRHGEKEGSCELNFYISNKNIALKRTLKRGKNGISQGNCEITIDGLKEILTPTQTKEKIFDILGYPKSLVSKNSTLIYKYSIYTPQEELKEIIYEDKDNRLEILRKIFGIDKYKRIINNLENYTRYLRKLVNNYEGRIFDLLDLENEYKSKKIDYGVKLEKKEKLLEELKEKEKELLESTKIIENKNKEIELIKDNIKQLNFSKITLNDKNKIISNNNKSLNDIESQIKTIEIKLKNESKDVSIIDLKPLEEYLSELTKEQNELISKKTSFVEKKKNILFNINKDEKLLMSKRENLESVTRNNSEILNLEIKTDFNLDDVEAKIKEIQAKILEDQQKLADKNAIDNKSKELIDSIDKLDNCPTCKQEVSNSHKDNIKSKEIDSINLNKESKLKISNNISKLNFEKEKYESELKEVKLNKIKKEQKEKISDFIKQIKNEISQIENNINNNKNDLKILEKENINESLEEEIKLKINKQKKKIELISNLNIKNTQIKALFEKVEIYQEQKISLTKRGKDLDLEVDDLNKKIELLNFDLKDHEEKLSEFNKLKQENVVLSNNFNEVNQRNAVLKKQLEIEKNLLSSLDLKIKNKIIIKDEIKRIKNIQSTISYKINKIMEKIEIERMQHIQIIFEQSLTNWFSKLIEGDNLNVRINEIFEPIIEQNGYDTNVMNLSGGEKTSLALSYRFALTKVLNNIITHIKTNQIIILDEPTDGFSSSQLDKLRDVLLELGIEQTIIVSHESKIESYVDNIVNIKKIDNISSIV